MSPVVARRSALKKLGAGAAAVWVAPAITTGASAGGAGSPEPCTHVSTEAELIAAVARGAGTILLCATTIPITSEINFDGPGSVVVSSVGPGPATLAGTTGAPLLDIGAAGIVTFESITVTGLGIRNGGLLTLVDCTVDGAATGTDAGVRSSGTLGATNTTFRTNTSTGFGGAIRATGGTVTLLNCSLSSNSAAEGAAVGIVDTTATFTNCMFTGNSATNNGGAISATGTSAFSTPGCSFSFNTASPGTGRGGAVQHAASGLYTVGTASFWSNFASEGTAIYRGANPIDLTGAMLDPGQTVVDP